MSFRDKWVKKSSFSISFGPEMGYLYSVFGLEAGQLSSFMTAGRALRTEDCQRFLSPDDDQDIDVTVCHSHDDHSTVSPF